MRIAVLGATGGIGTLAVDRLLANGHAVAAGSRSPMTERDPDARLTSKVGDLTDVGFLREALAGCDAVVSCLGQNRSSKSLFARRTSPPDILRKVAAATLAAIGDNGQHLVYVSAFGVGSDRKRHALPFRIVLRPSRPWSRRWRTSEWGAGYVKTQAHFENLEQSPTLALLEHPEWLTRRSQGAHSGTAQYV